MAGVSYSDELLGADLYPNVLKETSKDPYRRNYVVSEMNQLPIEGKSFVGRMVLTDRYKYILFDGGENREQLFDLQVDPGELKPVTQDPAYVHQLVAHREMLRDWISRSDDPFKETNIPSGTK
jgi:arylsulfatase A-like enzyme